MKIRSTLNGGVAEVSDEYGARLIAAGGWKSVAAPAATPEPAAPRKARVKKAPVEEPQAEE